MSENLLVLLVFFCGPQPQIGVYSETLTYRAPLETFYDNTSASETITQAMNAGRLTVAEYGCDEMRKEG